MKIWVIIPTYNERDNIEELLNRLCRVTKENNINATILVIDDNSPDGTQEIVKEFAKKQSQCNIKLIVRQNKRGLGSAILDGLKIALQDPSSTHFVTMDADLSHRPEDLPNLLSKISIGDVVQGSRYISGGRIIGWGFHRYVISYVANFLIRTLYKTRIRDHTSNYRIYDRRAAELLIKYANAKSYEWAIESILIPIACGCNVIESPIVFINRMKGKSKLSLRDILRWWFYIVSFKKKFNEIKKSCTEINSSKS